MRKQLCLLLAFSLCALALAACGGTSASSEAPAQPTPAVTAAPLFAADPALSPYTGLPKGEGYPEGERGVAVMISNVKPALPQSGLNAADLVYEMVTEGGITRLMAVYRDRTAIPLVGPIRSARDQHVQLMIPLNCLYAHVGGSSYALEMLEAFRFTGTRSIDGKYKNFYWIDSGRRRTLSQEHCVYTDGPTLERALAQYELDTAGEPAPVFNFLPAGEPARALADGEAASVSFLFSPYDDARFDYDPESGRYFKSQFGEPQLDAGDENRQYRVDNVFLLFTQVGRYPDGVLAQVHLEQGVGLYFSGGRYERVCWMKGAGEAPLRIVDDEGREQDITVNPGTSYIAFIGDDQLGQCRIDGHSLEELYG